MGKEVNYVHRAQDKHYNTYEFNRFVVNDPTRVDSVSDYHSGEENCESHSLSHYPPAAVNFDQIRVSTANPTEE